jgi:putative transposase
MPDHWHLVLWPRKDGDLSAFVGWLTLTHTQRLHAGRRSLGRGPVYQGRFKSFLVQPDEHLWMVCRYVERNPVRAGLCKRANQWHWSSFWRRKFPEAEFRKLLSRWPLAAPKNWASRIGRKESRRDLEALRQCVNRGQPLGNEVWVARMTKRFKLASTFRPRGRPRKKSRKTGS